MHLFKLSPLFLLLSSYALCNEETKGLCPDSNINILEHTFLDYHANVTHITKKMFENCNHLKTLILIFLPWKTYIIDADAFEDLKKLKIFALSGYKIPHVKRGFFKLTPSIAQIHLEDAHIEEFDSDAFEDFKDLEVITISSNQKWKHLPENLFRNLTKLTVIELHHNRLEGLTWKEFKGLTNMKRLYLRHNRISSIDVERIVKYMPNLELLQIWGNPVSNPIICDSGCYRRNVKEVLNKLNSSLVVMYSPNDH